MRMDESLYFANAKFLEAKVSEAVASNNNSKYLILNCSAINSLDASGLECLKAINQRLADGGIEMHLCEVKGPIMDNLKKTKFYQEIEDRVHLTHYQAISSINPDLAVQTLRQKGE